MTRQLNCRVLLVDDEPLIRNLISAYLEAAGFEVRTAVDGLDALQKLRAGVPDVIISDLSMPRMSGVELLHVVRHRFPRIPLIAITAGSIPDDLPAELSADVCWQKSAQGIDALLHSVTNLVRESSGRTMAAVSEATPDQARPDGDGHYIIHCQDCGRSIRVPRDSCVGPGEHCICCVHCGSPVLFLADSPK